MDTADLGLQALYIIMVLWAILAGFGIVMGLWDMKNRHGGH